MGGQGQSGTVRFAPHVEDMHKGWFGLPPYPIGNNQDVTMFIKNSFTDNGGNPYDGFSPTEPSQYMSTLPVFQNSLDIAVNGLDEEADYQRLVQNAVDKIDEHGVLKDIDTSPIIDAVRTEASDVIQDAIKHAVDMIDEETLSEIVQAYDQRSQHVRARATRRFAGTMADINAVNSSAFLFGMAIIEAEHMQGVNEFNKELTLKNYNDSIAIHVDLYRQRVAQELQKELTVKTIRDQMLMNSVQLTTQQMLTGVELKQMLLSIVTEVSRIRYVAQSEYEGFNLDVKNKRARWDLETYQLGTIILGGMGGGQFIPHGHNKAGSAIGGAMSGAASGAMMGSVVPGVGTALGAGIGAALGLGAGLLN